MDANPKVQSLLQSGFSKAQIKTLYDADPDHQSFIDLTFGKFLGWGDENTTDPLMANPEARTNGFMQVYQYSVGISGNRPNIDTFKTTVGRTGELLDAGFTMDQVATLLTNTSGKQDRCDIWDALSEKTEILVGLGIDRAQQVSKRIVDSGADAIYACEVVAGMLEPV